ncbi:hypothetical protein RB653_000151 [Dictyostelium firmibasis]|uniref:Cytochrome P450 n=1 Tax=Dictyostelium firmibasis TaxID=79012 RepID=A0AAN7U5L5_9MYCE
MFIQLLVLMFLIYFVYINTNLNFKQKRPPFPITFPIIGNLYTLLKNQPHYVLFKYYKSYGEIFQLKYGIINTVVLSEYDILKEAFIDNSDVFIERFNKISKKFKSSENIVNSNGSIWKKLQLISIKELSPNIKIKKYEPMILDEANKLIENLNEQAKTTESFDPTLNIKICYLNIILSFLFNFRYYDYKNEKVIKIVEYIHTIFRMGSHPIPYDYIPILYSLHKNKQSNHQKIFEELYQYVGEEVQKRLEIINKNNNTINKNNNYHDCFVDILLLKFKTNELTWNEVIKTTTDIMIAGSDTNSLYTIHLIIALTNREIIQDKVYKEILNFIENNNQITFSNKKYTPYYNSVLKEVERRYTVSPLSQPHRTNKDIWLKGYFIPSGSQIIQNVYSCHLNEKDWENPFEFIPERFLNNSFLEKRLITFGIGPRNCLGFQFALMTLWIVNFKLFESIKFSSNNFIQEEFREGGTTLSPFQFKLNSIKR